MTDLYRLTQSMSRNGPVAYALSGLDIALWDIAGKVAGQPIWRLLGGSGKARIPAYASLHRLAETAAVARVCAKAVERGYRHIKLHQHTVEALAAARGAVGPDIPLMVDVNCHWTRRADALAVARAMRPYDPAWLEEPLYPPEDYEELAGLRREAGVPIAAGENLGNVSDVRHISDAGAVDVVQPSVIKMGGITGMRTAIREAEGKSVRLVPHSPFLGPGLIAAMHLIAAMPGEGLCEHRYAHLEASPCGDWIVARDGYMHIPNGPGLGIEMDLGAIARYGVPITP